MSRHQKRQEVPKSWPIPRKGTTFVIRKNSEGIPLLILLRDVMGLVQNRRELKKAVHKKDLLVCSRPIIDDSRSVSIFDTITVVPAKKSYRVVLSRFGKYDIEEIDEKDSNVKISKIIGKKTLKGNKTQVNLLDGMNILCDKKCDVNDSVVVDLGKKSISKILPLKEKSDVLVIGGKHIGTKGKIVKMLPEHKMAEVESENATFNALIKQIIILE